MSNTMTSHGLSARIDFDADDNLVFGRLLGTTDVVGFHADTVEGLRAAFEEAVQGYLDTCQRLGKKPMKAASGKLMLRVPPEVHSAALMELGLILFVITLIVLILSKLLLLRLSANEGR